MSEAASASDRLKTLPAMTRRGLGEAAHVRGEDGLLQTLVLAEPRAHDDEVLGRLKQRVRLVTQLDHACLVRVLDGGVDNGEGRPWLLEQAVAGRTLRRHLDEEGALGPADALQVGLDVLNGLEYLHRRGMLHGGLSPEQVLISRDEGREDGRWRGRLLEPGLVHLLRHARSTPFGPLRVDPDYASPELVRGEPLTPTADVYSAALLIEEALTGRHPIPAPARNRLLHRLNEPARPLDPGTLEDEAREEVLRAALGRATLKDPARRFGSARGFALALCGQPTDDPGEVVARDGGPCAACDAAIPPLARRTWGRHDTNRPFRCARCERDFCGLEHWDRLGWTCAECSERSLRAEAPARKELVRFDAAVAPLPGPATPQGEGPTGSVESKESDAVRRRQTMEKARRPSERLLALRELLTSSKEGRPSLDTGEAGASAQRPASPRERSEPSSAGEELFLGAWEREKERRTTALARAEEARARRPQDEAPAEQAPAPSAESADETERLPRPGSTQPGTGSHARPSRRPGSGSHGRPSAASRRPSGSGRAGDGRTLGRPATATLTPPARPVWQGVAGVLLVALVYMAWGWNSQLEHFASRERELRDELSAAKSSSTDAELLGERSDLELRALRRERDALRADLRELEAARDALTRDLAGARAQVTRGEQALAAVRVQLARVEASANDLQRRLVERDAQLTKRDADAQRATLALAREREAGQATQLERDRLAGELDALRPRRLALAAGVAVVPGEPRVLTCPEQAREALAAGRRGDALLALRLTSTGPTPRLLLGGQPLPAGEGEGGEGGEVRRYWLDAARCAALLDGPLELAAGFGGGAAPTEVVTLELVATPLAPDVARRLAELGRRSAW